MLRRVLTLGLVLTGALVLVIAPAAGAQTGSLTLDPSTVVAGGGKLFISGTCEANTSGFIISHAFAGQPSVGEFAGVPALPFTTGSAGTFGVGLTIAPTVAPGAYSVSVRCGGGLAASGTLTVVSGGLAPTGAPLGDLAAVGAVTLIVGLALSPLRRYRASAR